MSRQNLLYGRMLCYGFCLFICACAHKNITPLVVVAMPASLAVNMCSARCCLDDRHILWLLMLLLDQRHDDDGHSHYICIEKTSRPARRRVFVNGLRLSAPG